MRNYLLFFLILTVGTSCHRDKDKPVPGYAEDYTATALQSMGPSDSAIFVKYTNFGMAKDIVAFAKKQLGIQYKYCSMCPADGFDCSGFINYVFNHFNIKVPRSSVDFNNIGTEVSLSACKPGDLILFTGTDSRKRTVGHVGLIITNDKGDISFIQATSGAEYCVTITKLNESYMERFVKVIRIIDNG